MSDRVPYDARAVANFILDFADEQNTKLTQLSLYKIIYFAHGWYLAKTETPLISQEFEAWDRGPVVKVLRDNFKSFQGRHITARASKLDIYTGQVNIVRYQISLDDQQFIESIFSAYHIYDAWKLSEMTHEVGSPWDQIWNAPVPIGRLGLRIRNEDIRVYFSRIPHSLRAS